MHIYMYIYVYTYMNAHIKILIKAVSSLYNFLDWFYLRITNICLCVSVDEDCEPLQKKLHLPSDEQDDADSHQFSVVTLPSEAHTDMT